jgi:NAD(P)H-dependent flavin oxidoreductase YrpB (nitropropane dioxygenase family)
LNRALRTPVCEHLGLEVPIFGFAHSIEVTAAICNAGGLGVYGATRDTPDEIAERLALLREMVGDRPFGVDLVLPQGMPERDDRDAIEAAIPEGHREFVADLEQRYDVPPGSAPGKRSRFVRSEDVAQAQVEAVLDSDVDLFACGIGMPFEAVERAKKDGKTTLALIGRPRHAHAALEAGADILVAQGHDAGAHTGPIGTLSLVPQIVDQAAEVPVLAAGGIATGRQIVAALAMGAQGVWLGTVWLPTKEHALDEILIRKLLAAGSGDTVISRADSGKTLRQIRTAWSDEWAQEGAPAPLAMPWQDILVGDLLGAIDEHRVEPLMHQPAGQSIAYCERETTVAEVIDNLVRESDETLTRLTKG